MCMVDRLSGGGGGGGGAGGAHKTYPSKFCIKKNTYIYINHSKGVWNSVFIVQCEFAVCQKSKFGPKADYKMTYLAKIMKLSRIICILPKSPSDLAQHI